MPEPCVYSEYVESFEIILTGDFDEVVGLFTGEPIDLLAVYPWNPVSGSLPKLYKTSSRSSSR